MPQINFRLTDEEKLLITAMADLLGNSVSEYIKNTILSNIQPNRTKIAMDLLKQHKLSRKRSWMLSGLSYHEFLLTLP